jgi:hypothetical protein
VLEKPRGGETSGAEPVAQVIADAVEGTGEQVVLAGRRRRRHGLGLRTTMDDETFEATMRAVLELTCSAGPAHQRPLA